MVLPLWQDQSNCEQPFWVATMLTLHHLNTLSLFAFSGYLKLGADYELKIYERDPKTYQAPAELKKLSPLGSAPVITDDQVTLAESSAIIDYLLDHHPESELRVSPDSEDRVRYLFWMHASQGSMMSLMLMEAVFQILIFRVPFLVRPMIKAVLEQAKQSLIKPRMASLLKIAEADLKEATYVGGDKVKADDIAMIYPKAAAKDRYYLDVEYHECNAWLDRVQQYDFRSAAAKDGRDSIILRV